MIELFRFLPFAWRLAVIGGVAVVAVGVFTAYSVKVYNKGWNAAIAGVANRNAEHLRAVKKAVSSVDECSANGGFWDTVSGVCH